MKTRMGDDIGGRDKGYTGTSSNGNIIGQNEVQSRGEDGAEKAKEEGYVQIRNEARDRTAHEADGADITHGNGRGGICGT